MSNGDEILRKRNPGANRSFRVANKRLQHGGRERKMSALLFHASKDELKSSKEGTSSETGLLTFSPPHKDKTALRLQEGRKAGGPSLGKSVGQGDPTKADTIHSNGDEEFQRGAL